MHKQMLSTFSPVIYLHLVPRITGVTSMISSSVIIYVIVRSAQRLSTVYHRIMFCMSVFDIIGSFAMALTFLPMPKEMPLEEELGISFPGSRYGNTFTCNLQGFSVMFGASCMLGYNGALCTYYACAIFFRMKEESIRKYVQPFLFLYPIMGGLAVAAPPLFLDLYNPPLLMNNAWCTISTYPVNCGDTCIRGNYSNFFSQINRISIIWISNFVMIAISQALVILRTCLHSRQSLRQTDKDENDGDRDEFESDYGVVHDNGGNSPASITSDIDISYATPSVPLSNTVSSIGDGKDNASSTGLPETLHGGNFKREVKSSSLQSGNMSDSGNNDISEPEASVSQNSTSSRHKNIYISASKQQAKVESPCLHNTERSLNRGNIVVLRNDIHSDEEEHLGQDERNIASDEDSTIEDMKLHTDTNPISLALQALAYVSVFGLTFMLWLSLYNLGIDEELWLKLWMLIFPLHGFFNLVIFLFHKVYNYRRLHTNESVGRVISLLLLRTNDVQEPCFVERISIVRDYHSSLEGPSNTTALRLSNELGDRILIRRSALVGKRSSSGENSAPSIMSLFRWTLTSDQPDDSNRELASTSDRVSRTSRNFDLSVDSSSYQYEVSHQHDKSSPSRSSHQLSGFSSVLDEVSLGRQNSRSPKEGDEKRI